MLVLETLWTQHRLKLLAPDRHPLHLAGYQLFSGFSVQRSDYPLQITDARLPGIAADQLMEGVVGDFYRFTGQAVLFHLLGNQMPFGDLEFFLVSIAGQLNDVHTVQQRPRDHTGVVGRGDKQYVAQVKGKIDIMILEGIVLLRIQHLQQRRGRITLVIRAQLINFIQQNQGVSSARLVNGGNDPAGHGAYVGPSVSPDIRFIPHAA